MSLTSRGSYSVLFICLCGVLALTSRAQNIRSVNVSTAAGMAITGYVAAGGEQVTPSVPLPVFTCTVNEKHVSALSFRAELKGDSIRWESSTGLSGGLRVDSLFRHGWKATVTFHNVST